MKSVKQNKKRSVSKFQHLIEVLIAIFIIPVLMVSLFSIYVHTQTKKNSMLPSGFNKTVITVQENFDDFLQGQKVIVSKIAPEQIMEGNYVAFYVASEEPNQNGGSAVAFKKVRVIQAIDGKLNFGFTDEEYFQIEDSIIGLYDASSSWMIDVLTFFSTQTVLILAGLLPLIVLLLLLGMNIVEHKNAQKVNEEIDTAILKASQSGFDTTEFTKAKNDDIEPKIEINKEELFVNNVQVDDLIDKKENIIKEEQKPQPKILNDKDENQIIKPPLPPKKSLPTRPITPKKPTSTPKPFTPPKAPLPPKKMPPMPPKQ